MIVNTVKSFNILTTSFVVIFLYIIILMVQQNYYQIYIFLDTVKSSFP